MGWEKAFSNFFFGEMLLLEHNAFLIRKLCSCINQQTPITSCFFFFFGGGIKTIPWTYVRQEILFGTSGIHPPGRHAVQRGQPSTCSSAEALPWERSFVVGLSVGSLDKSRRSEVSVDEYEVQRWRGGFVFFWGFWVGHNKRNRETGRKKTAHVFFCVCLW